MRRRIRLRPLMPPAWVARSPEGPGYTPPPPSPDDGPVRRYYQPPERGLGMLTAAEAFLVYSASHADAVDAWRDLFPGSAEVFDGVRSTEAGVDVDWITTDGEGGGDDGRQ